MAYSVSTSLRSLLDTDHHRFCTLWKITRKDGTILRFTDHNETVTPDDNVYTPVGGLASTSVLKGAGLKTQNFEVVGLIDSSAITEEDLLAGRYREARVLERIVDWKYPWQGDFLRREYWIIETQFNEILWEARVAGVTRWLRNPVGDNHTRTCRHTLYDGSCTVDRSSFQQSGSVTSVSDARREFTIDVVEADGYFEFGEITFTDGDNQGLSFEIRSHESNVIYLETRTPFDIDTDSFTIVPGCNKTTDHCKNKFSNLVNFGGFHFIPGTDKMLQTPGA